MVERNGEFQATADPMKAIVSILCFLISSSLFADDIKALKAKAEKGDAKAQFQLAEAFYYGKGVE